MGYNKITVQSTSNRIHFTVYNIIHQKTPQMHEQQIVILI